MMKHDKKKSANATSIPTKKRKKIVDDNKKREGGIDEFDVLFSDKKKRDRQKKEEEAAVQAAKKASKKARYLSNGSSSSSLKKVQNADTSGGEWVDDGLGGIYNKEGYTGRVEDGVKIFKRHILNKPGAGSTDLCPFDCNCCFI